MKKGEKEKKVSWRAGDREEGRVRCHSKALTIVSEASVYIMPRYKRPMDNAKARLVNSTHTTCLIVIKRILSAASAPDGADRELAKRLMAKLLAGVLERGRCRWPE